MAPKRPSHLEDPVAAPSSSSEEDDASSEEEEEEEDEEEPAEKAPPKKASTLSSPIKKPPSKTQPAESFGESSSDSEPGGSAAVKPIASKPMQDSAAAKKSRTKTPAKRPSDGEASASAAKSSKRAKTKPDAAVADETPAKSSGGATAEKKLFQRLWSEEDEVAILRGMLDYSKKGSDPITDMVGFQGFIRKSIAVQDFTKSQLQDKVRRLKKKYVNNVKKKKYEPTNPLEKTVFELSKKIWGNKPVPGPGPNGTPSSAAAAPSNGKAATPKAKPMPEADANASDSGILSGVVGLERSPMPEAVVRRGLDLIAEDKKAKLEADWRKIHLAEVELFAKKTQLMSEQSRLIFEALRSDS